MTWFALADWRNFWQNWTGTTIGPSPRMKAEMQKRFASEAKMLSVFRERAKAEVKRWVYSTEEIWSYDDLRSRGSRSSLLPGPEGALFACGYDAAERPIVLQQFEEVDDDDDGGS